MTDTSNTLEAVYAALDQLNRQRPSDRRLPRDPATLLIGPDGRLDSLGLVTFIVALEQQIEDRFGRAVPLTDPALLAADDGPMRSVGTLAAYLKERIGKGEHG